MTMTYEKTPRFENVYPRAPFSELIRLVLKATEASRKLAARLSHRRPMRPATKH